MMGVMMRKTPTKTRSDRRPFSFLKSVGDIEWLRRQTCPKCDRKGMLMLTPGGSKPNGHCRCLECGATFVLRGRRQ